jgi:tRNA(Ile)-lysidine synthase TilS/MesJ
MARHRAVLERPRWWRRSLTQAMVPAQRVPSVEVVDALTKLAHRVSFDELVTGHQRGDYVGSAVLGSWRRAGSIRVGASASRAVSISHE